jgi:hypothetical protein
MNALPLFCPDCANLGRQVPTVQDMKHAGPMGCVCPQCERVYNLLAPACNLHYASEKACMAAIDRYVKTKQKMIKATEAMIKGFRERN